MPTMGDVCRWMKQLAPLELSEPWDNTGLLLGDPGDPVSRVQTCLTLTSESTAEAIDQCANLVIVHHPLLFKPVKSITTATAQGKLLWQLARSGISVYSPHTAWDSAEAGINAMLAERLKLREVRPLIPANLDGNQTLGAGFPLSSVCQLGAGRLGLLSEAMEIRQFAAQVKSLLPESRTRGVDSGRPVRRIAIACGSGGSLLSAAIQANCELFLTGEATFHTCMEAQAAGVSMLLIGHFASERFSLVELAQQLHRHFSDLTCWASHREADAGMSFT